MLLHNCFVYRRKMNSSFDFHLKTKLNDFKNTTVFTTNKTLNERFTLNPPPSVFVLRNGYTAPFKDNCVTERVVYENRRAMDTDKRFSLYQAGHLKLLEKELFGNEGKNQLRSEIREIGNKRRKVLMPSKFSDEKQTRYCYEESEKPKVLSPDYYNINSSSSYFDFNTPKSSRFYKLQKTEQLSEKNDKFKNSISFGRVPPVKRFWDGRTKDNFITTDDCFDDREPITYSPYPVHRNSYYSQQSVYKWKRGPPTKEELDQELDIYMAETKLKSSPTTPVVEDIDSFVQEYMIETEKCLNQAENVDVSIE